MVALLLAHGADARTSAPSGATALAIARGAPNPAVVGLLERHALPNTIASGL